MRRALVVVLLIVVLLGIDVIFNDFRFSAAMYREVLEFGRLFTRTVDEIF
jgi:hypothetical protein